MAERCEYPTIILDDSSSSADTEIFGPFWSHFGDLCLFNNGWWRWMHIIQTASKVHIVIEDPEPVTALLKGGPQLHHSQWPTSTMMYQAIWRDKLWSKHQKMISTNNRSFSDTCPHWSSMKMNVVRCSTHNTHTHTLKFRHYSTRISGSGWRNQAAPIQPLELTLSSQPGPRWNASWTYQCPWCWEVVIGNGPWLKE